MLSLHTYSWVEDTLIKLQVLVDAIYDIEALKFILRVNHHKTTPGSIRRCWPRLFSRIDNIHPQIQLLGQS